MEHKGGRQGQNKQAETALSMGRTNAPEQTERIERGKANNVRMLIIIRGAMRRS